MQAPGTPQSDRGTSTWDAVKGFIGNRVTDSNALMNTDGFRYILYALMAGIIIATAIMVVDNFYPFLPMNPISGPSALARSGTTFWTTSAENMIVPSAQSPTTVANNYSMSVQIMIGDSRTPSAGFFRHIVHRGSNPCGISSSTAGASGHAGISPSAIPSSADPSYIGEGLPAIMNPGIFLDEYKNDIHVFVHTRGTEAGLNVIWLESMTIEDLPLQAPITLGVVLNGQSLEVYINCRLYSTQLLRGAPYLPAGSNQWFGRYCAYPMSGLVQNLTLWSAALGSSDYIQMCQSPSMSTSNLPQVCLGSS